MVTAFGSQPAAVGAAVSVGVGAGVESLVAAGVEAVDGPTPDGTGPLPQAATATTSSPDGRAELQCDRVAPTYVRVVLSETGPGVVQENLGEAPCCGGEVLGYGQTWSRGPFTCQSAEAGLTCTNADGNSFMLSRDTASIE